MRDHRQSRESRHQSGTLRLDRKSRELSRSQMKKMMKKLARWHGRKRTTWKLRNERVHG